MRLHFFRHPWSLQVRYRCPFNEVAGRLNQGDTLSITVREDVIARIAFTDDGEIIVTMLRPVIGSLRDLRRWAEFAESEQS